MNKKLKINREFKDFKVILFQEDTVSTYPVTDLYSDVVEYENGTLKVADSEKYYDAVNGGISYVFNLDLPAQVEAENLKTLRRSTAIHNLFSYDRHKKFDLVSIMPWLIIILLVLFK